MPPGSVKRRFTEVDLFFLLLWAVVAYESCTTLLTLNLFFSLSAIGGVALVARFFYATVYKGMANEGDLVLAAGLPLVLLAGGWPIRWITELTPHTYDALLLWTDCGISAGIRTWAIGHLWIYQLLEIAYVGLPLAIIAGLVTTSGDQRKRLACGLAFGGILCLPCYLMFPAVGPAHVGDPLAFRNCMPSMHLT